MDRRTSLITVVLVVLVAGAAVYILTDDGPGSAEEPVADAEYVTDAAGRQVPIPDDITKGIATIGKCGPLRFLSIFNTPEHDYSKYVIECDKTDASMSKGARGFLYAFDYTGATAHADFTLDSETVERIASKDPAVTIISESLYYKYQANADALSRKVPVLVIPEQVTKSFYDPQTFELDQWYKDIVNMIGKVLKQEERAQEHISQVEGIIRDIRTNYVGSTDDTSYVVGVAASGSHEWNTTFPTYIPLDLAGGKNAYTASGTEATNVQLQTEEAVKVILSAKNLLIDPTSSDKMNVPNTQAVMKAIYGVNNDSDPDNDIRLFVTMSMVWCSTNYDSAMAGAYYLCHILYGTLTLDEVKEKINGIYHMYYGEAGDKVLDEMTEFFNQKAKPYNVSVPMLSEVKIVNRNGLYTTEPIPA